jgi:hypothetical protein
LFLTIIIEGIKTTAIVIAGVPLPLAIGYHYGGGAY